MVGKAKRSDRQSVAKHQVSSLVLVALCAACGGPEAQKGGRPKGPVVVRVQAARIEQVERIVEVTGTVAGVEEMLISAEVEGRVEKIAADLGDTVAAGALLVQLQSTTPRLLAEQAEADYLQALAVLGVEDGGLETVDPATLSSVKRAQADLEEQKRNVGRLTELLKKGVVTQNDVDTILTRERIADAALQQAREQALGAMASARSRRAALGLARKQLRDTSISTPVAGIVAERLVTLGQFVRPGDPVARVVVANPLKLQGDVPERYASDIQTGMPVAVALDALRTSVQGNITRVGPAIAAASRTFKVEALIPNDDGKVKPGAFARARVVVGNDEEVVAVPETAVATSAGVSRVYVFEDGKAKERRVDLLRKRGSDALIAGDIQAGDRIILTAIARLYDGADVTIDGEQNRAGGGPPRETPDPSAPPPGAAASDAAPADAGPATESRGDAAAKAPATPAARSGG